MTFSVGQDDTIGEYAHELTIAEMPRHSHTQDSSELHSRRCGGNCGSLVPGAAKQTGIHGGDEAHNNIPPFFVVNFCKFSPNPQ